MGTSSGQDGPETTSRSNRPAGWQPLQVSQTSLNLGLRFSINAMCMQHSKMFFWVTKLKTFRIVFAGSIMSLLAKTIQSRNVERIKKIYYKVSNIVVVDIIAQNQITHYLCLICVDKWFLNLKFNLNRYLKSADKFVNHSFQCTSSGLSVPVPTFFGWAG